MIRQAGRWAEYVGPRTDANVYKIYYCLGGAVGSVAGGSCVARPGNICADYMPDPIATASLVRGTNGADLNWPLSMVVSGNYAYVGNYNSKSLEVFDISNLANPVHKAIIYGSAGVALNNISGMGISGNYLYALDGSSNAMEVVNISNPLSPSAVVKLSVTNGYQIANNIFVSGNYAYLTSNSAGCQNCYSSFRVVDISVPASANIKGSVNDGVGGAYLTDAAGVYVVGNYAYLAVRDGNTGGSIGGLEIIDVSNPIAPVHKSTLMNGSGGASLVHPNDIVVSGNYAYIATHGDSPFTGSKAPGLEIVNISNPSSPVHVGSILSGQGGAVFSNSGQKVLVQGNYAFIADPNDGIVEVVNVSNPSAPTHITTIGSSSGAALSNIAGMFLSNYNLYTVGGFQNNSLNVINLR